MKKLLLVNVLMVLALTITFSQNMEDTMDVELPEPALAQIETGENPPEDDAEQVALIEPTPPAFPSEPEPSQPVQPPTPPLLPPAAPAPTPAPAPPAAPEPMPPPELAQPPLPDEEEPPPSGREPLPRIIPELPFPSQGITGSPDEKTVFSRIVRATAGQLVEIPFRGSGWVYLGEIGSRRGISYDSRRLDSEGQSFIFRTESAGVYALKFFRQDFIRDFIINDHVQVIVGEAPESGAGWFSPPIDRGRVIAEPRWPGSLAEAQALRADTRPAQPPSAGVTAATPAAPAVSPQPPIALPMAPETVEAAVPPSAVADTAPPPPVTPASPPVQPPSRPDAPQTVPVPDSPPIVYLNKAREEFDAGQVASAISQLDLFCRYYPSGSDEAWWLYGQCYEANSPSRNILTALDYYRRLVRDYPQSGRFDDARRRISYLERYYINIQ